MEIQFGLKAALKAAYCNYETRRYWMRSPDVRDRRDNGNHTAKNVKTNRGTF